MKKRFLCLFLVICMVLSLLPIVSMAATTNYNIWVGGIQITSANANDVLNDGGKVKFDESTSTLTLNNANITTGFYSRNALAASVVHFTQAATLKLLGNNTISASGTSEKNFVTGIYTGENSPLTITGPGTLQIHNLPTMFQSAGIEFTSPLIIENCDITILNEEAGEKSYGIFNWVNYDFTLRNNAMLQLSAPNGTGFALNSGGADGTIDKTSILIAQGGILASLMSPILSSGQIMTGSINYDGTGATPTTSISLDYKYLKVEPNTIVAPSITSQPANTNIKAGETATFTVSASSTEALTYQCRYPLIAGLLGPMFPVAAAVPLQATQLLYLPVI